MTAAEVEVLAVVVGLDVNRGAEAKIVNIKENDMGGGDSSGKLDRRVTVEALKGK